MVCLGTMLLGCGDEPAQVEALLFPSQATFPLVNNALERRCATLDCHGQPARNLRLYGRSGMRLLADDVPGQGKTTPEEHAASYASVVALEPEVLSIVVLEKGEAPERLTLVRKARGEEAHKGGSRLKAGDAADQCLTSWIAGETNEEACSEAAELEPPWE